VCGTEGGSDERTEGVMEKTNMNELTKDQRVLLLYLECRAVDYGGRVDGRHMNEADFVQATAWDAAGFIGFGRIVAADCSGAGSHWVTLSEAAWEAAHRERRARADRMLSSRTYMTTKEKRTTP
jgi:hypothetical protein